VKVSLRPVTRSNYEEVCELDVAKEQEEFVACNMWSLVESMFNEGYETKAIYLNEEPVGFFMWVQESKDKVSIWRFMVDIKNQQKGIGRKALSLALNEIKQVPDLKQIEICYNPNNPVAKEFYSSFGFAEVGMDEDGEDMLAIIEI
jgi:diamine N-acetyltransferase